MKLKSEYFIAIRDALLDAFRRPARLQSMVRATFDVNLEEIVTQKGTYFEQVEDLLRWAEERDSVEALVAVARKANETNKILKTVEGQLLSSDEDAYIARSDTRFEQPTDASGLTGKREEATSSPYYTCFISYSSKDEEFAEKLFNDLIRRGVSCWYAEEHLPISIRIRDGLDEAIVAMHKTLLILSSSSIGSDWVEAEVEATLEWERNHKPVLKIFPLRIDDEVMSTNVGWAAYIRRTRNIGDFRNWQDESSYAKTLRRVLRDLAIVTGESNG